MQKQRSADPSVCDPSAGPNRAAAAAVADGTGMVAQVVVAAAEVLERSVVALEASTATDLLLHLVSDQEWAVDHSAEVLGLSAWAAVVVAAVLAVVLAVSIATDLRHLLLVGSDQKGVAERMPVLLCVDAVMVCVVVVVLAVLCVGVVVLAVLCVVVVVQQVRMGLLLVEGSGVPEGEARRNCVSVEARKGKFVSVLQQEGLTSWLQTCTSQRT